MTSLLATATKQALRSALRVARRNRPDPDVEMDEAERYAIGAAQVRATMDRAGVLYRRPSDVTIDDAAGPAGGLWVRPEGSVAGRTVLFLHGGAYLAGSPSTHRGIATAVGRAGRSDVVLPQYRLAPEHRFPAAIDDALATYRWLLDDVGQDPASLVVAGDSAGGGLALALAVAVRDEGLPQPAGVVALSPWADLTGSGRSLLEVGRRDPWVDASTIEPAGRMYAGERVRDPWASPVFADYAGMPPLLVHVGSDEVLLDDARRVVERATVAGVDAQIEVFDGLFHVFQAFRFLPEARRSVAAIGEWIQRVTVPVGATS